MITQKKQFRNFLENFFKLSSQIKISLNDYYELRNLHDGVYYPLKNLVNKSNFDSIAANNRTAAGEIFPLPIFLDVDIKGAEKLSAKKNCKILLKENVVGEIEVNDIYKINKRKVCKKLFNTNDLNHPGVYNFLNKKEFFIGGKVLLNNTRNTKKKDFYFKPSYVKEIFSKNGWKSIVGFQTRNIPHRAHEHLLRTALEFVDGLFIQPLVGNKKKGDFTNEIIFKCYNLLINNFLPKNKIELSSLLTSMWYAGPREALFHSIIRRNYGCTHFIVGRDHAGIGNYYGKYDAHKLLAKYENEIGIIIMKLSGPFYCSICEGIATEESCPHYENNKDKITEISGTDIRKKLNSRNYISKKIIRPEIVNALKNSSNIFI